MIKANVDSEGRLSPRGHRCDLAGAEHVGIDAERSAGKKSRRAAASGGTKLQTVALITVGDIFPNLESGKLEVSLNQATAATEGTIIYSVPIALFQPMMTPNRMHIRDQVLRITTL